MRPFSSLDSLRQILKSSSFTYESSGSFFKTTNEMQSGPDTFEESRFVMIFLTNSGPKQILCSFRLALEGKAGKKIPESSKLEFLEKFFCKQFCFFGSRRQHLKSSKLRRYSRFTVVEKTISDLPKVMLANKTFNFCRTSK